MVAFMREEHGLSIRAACRAMNISRTVYHYQPDIEKDQPVINTLLELVDRYPRYGFGKLFPDNTRLLVYPEIDKAGEFRDYTNIDLAENLQFLYRHLVENGFIFGIDSSDHELFKIFSRNVLKQLHNGRGEWEQCVPPGVAEEIIENRLFGYRD